jgi:ABC-type Fe3+-hydroxamate transport system substrate-binding protein
MLLVLALVACADRESAPDRPGAAPRIVSLHDVTTEIVVALGASDRLVGIGELVDATPEVQDSVARVPQVAGLESILARRPDVVLGLEVVGERDPELVAQLRDRGIAVYLADPATLDDVYAMIRVVAVHAGAAGAGERVVDELRARIERSIDTAAREGSAARRPRVFVYDCCEPPFTAGGDTVLTDVIARAGGDNVFADLATDWTTVSWEAVALRRPDVVVIHAYAMAGQGDVADKRRTLVSRSALAQLPTVVVPLGWSLGGLRSVDALERLRRAMSGERRGAMSGERRGAMVAPQHRTMARGFTEAAR